MIRCPSLLEAVLYGILFSLLLSFLTGCNGGKVTIEWTPAGEVEVREGKQSASETEPEPAPRWPVKSGNQRFGVGMESGGNIR